MVATGSMDNISRLYDVETGHCLHTLVGHTGEVVSLDFNSTGKLLATGSFDHTVKIWDTNYGSIVHTLKGHRGEISNVKFKFLVGFISLGQKLELLLITINLKILMHSFFLAFCILISLFAVQSNLCLSASIDQSCKNWDAKDGNCLHTLGGYEDEILDVTFNISKVE